LAAASGRENAIYFYIVQKARELISKRFFSRSIKESAKKADRNKAIEKKIQRHPFSLSLFIRSQRLFFNSSYTLTKKECFQFAFGRVFYNDCAQ
jgi:hypothetical protein